MLLGKRKDERGTTDHVSLWLEACPHILAREEISDEFPCLANGYSAKSTSFDLGLKKNLLFFFFF